MSQVKPIAVVILNWNGVALLQQFLPKVVALSPQARVYLADNASDDDSIAWTQAHLPDVTIIRNDGNYGYAKGYNQALQQVEEPLYALVNSDIDVTENWLEPILERFYNEPDTAVIQPKIRDFKEPTRFEYAGAAGGFIDKFGFPFCRGRIFDTVEVDNGQYDDACDVFWASGACFFIRKEVFRKMKGFDDDFFAHQEEIDLCWRIFNHGYRLRYEPKSVVFHVGGATLQYLNPRKTYLNFRNSLFMMVKNLPKRVAFRVLFSRLVLDGVAGMRFLVTMQWGHVWAILKAHAAFYFYLPRYLSRRGPSQRLDYFHIESIAWRYFNKKQQTFGELSKSQRD